MKRIFVQMLVLMVLLLLPGCSRLDAHYVNRIEEESGMTKTPDYQAYQRYEEAGNLDQDGYYLQDAFETEEDEEAPQGTVRVTFAANAFLKVQYYTDSAFSDSISSNEVYFKPGESIYAEVTLEKTAPSSTYAFSAFRISELDAEGKSTLTKTVTPGETGLIMQISEEDVGKELSIAPMGKYLPRTISFKDSFLDNDEQEHALSGKWMVNDKPVIGHSAEINPVSSYIISYEFDSDQYFFVSSEPNCFYSNNEDGVVIFNKREATDETQDYSVRLHQYVTVELPSNRNRHVSVNNGYEQEIRAGGVCEIKHHKYGDKLVVVTDAEWQELSKSRNPILLGDPELLEQNGQQIYKYTLVIPQKDWQFEFNPSDYNYSHGTLSFKCFGEDVTSITYLSKDSRIEYDALTTEEGYMLPQGDHVIIVTTPEETKKALESISFEEAKRVTVQLKQPSTGGRIEYYVNSKLIQASEYKGDSGTIITMRFYPWEGWVPNYKNNTAYRITSSDYQTVLLGGKDISTSAFWEDPEHKPSLEVILDSSVGSDMRFEVEASGLKLQEYKYESPYPVLDFDKTIITGAKVGTEKGISILMSNRAIQSGTAMKIQVEMSGEDKSGSEPREVHTSYYQLIDSMADAQTTIDVYDADLMGSSSVWYEEIKITISLVDVIKYSQPKVPATKRLTVRNLQTGNVLKSGDILEGSEKVTVTISGANGYYIGGKNVKNGVYQTIVTFADCISGIQKMIDEHPAIKYCKVTLNSEDIYGTGVFKYNGRVVSGTILVKPGEIITLEYTITDPNYAIDGVSGFLWLDADDTKVEKSLKIEETYDGKTITKDSFGIVVRRR